MKHYAVTFILYDRIDAEKPLVASTAFITASSEEAVKQQAEIEAAKAYGEMFVRFPEGKYATIIKEIPNEFINCEPMGEAVEEWAEVID